jgi:hypothetical protein
LLRLVLIKTGRDKFVPKIFKSFTPVICRVKGKIFRITINRTGLTKSAVFG